MLINNLKLFFFRNFEEGELHSNDSINIFSGKNGSGKTNLLEAIFVILLGRSQRGAPDRVLLREGDNFYRLEAQVTVDNKKYSSAIAYQKGGRKKIQIEQVTTKTSELFERHAVVSSAPEDIAILSGPPSSRRDFINLYLSQASPRYIADLTDYQKALIQKNAYLKQEDNAANTPYDDLLVEYGAPVILARFQFLEKIKLTAESAYKKISKGNRFGIIYNPSVALPEGDISLDKIKDSFAEKLKRYAARERIMQVALVGPHRDEIDFSIGEFPARAYGSQGELRTATVALKMGVFEYLKSIRNDMPILLLDEIFAELDESRKELLVETFGQFGQVFLTSASGLPDSLHQDSQRFEIENGVIMNQ
ncbi:MAG TPA: DNA replication/repair protein RecF [candidate division Zixibacteria bacterium]|nr:DNA replication/repair protein RecF [candidate division Zixibacteria bacterium]